VERFVAVHVVMNAFHLVGHLQIHPIRNLTGDVVKAGHKALEVFHVFLKNINSKVHLGMEHVRKIMDIMDDEMFPTKKEWAYVKICNELKQIHLHLQELTRLKIVYAPATIDPSAHIQPRSSARVDPSAP
jgi:hypothetical protein